MLIVIPKGLLFSLAGWLAGKGEIRAQQLTALLHTGDDFRLIYLNLLHIYNATKKYLIPLLSAAVFTLILFRENRVRVINMSSTESLPQRGMLPVVALLLLVRNMSFLFLVFTEMIFRDHLSSDLLYLCELIHTFAAFVLIAVYAAKIYSGISQRLYFLQRSKRQQ